MTLDDQLSAFLGEEPRQSRADVFTAEVMKAVERRVFLDRLAALAAGAVVFGLVLWALSPVLNLLTHAIAPSLAPICGGLVFVAAIVMSGGPQVWRRLSIG
jgi:hypothetical protein